jgi:hypothetical protein
MDNSNGLLAKPRGNRSIQIRQVLKQKDFLVTLLVPLSIYVFILFFVTFGFMQLPSICILLAFACLALAATLFSMRSQVAVFLQLSLLIVPAVVVGFVFGLYTYDTQAIYPMFYHNARVYTDVVPSQSSAAVAAAGKLLFSSASFVDRNSSVGYITERGNLFCIAPVRDGSTTSQVEFWAVGIGCCKAEGGEFWCDASENSKAKGGIVIFDNNGLFSSSHQDEFRKAKLKAVATFNLLADSEPMFVQWVENDNLNMVSNEYKLKTSLFLTGFIVLYAAISFGLAFAIYKPRREALPASY